MLVTVLAVWVLTAMTTVSAEFVGECSENSLNLTESLQRRISWNGVCEPYSGKSQLCNPVIEAGLDYVYIPYSRLRGDQDRLAFNIYYANAVADTIPVRCKEVARSLLCTYYFIPCGRNGTLIPPQAICTNECEYLSIDLCPEEWQLVSQQFAIDQEYFDRVGLSLPNCSNPGKILEPLPYCCSSVITIPDPTNTTSANTTMADVNMMDNVTNPITETTLPLRLPLRTITAATVAGGGGLIVLSASTLVFILCLCRFHSHHHSIHMDHLENNKSIGLAHMGDIPRVTVEDTSVEHYSMDPRLSGPPNGVTLRPPQQHHEIRVPSAYLRQISGGHLIPHNQLHLLECIGQGEFGVVYRAKWTGQQGKMPEIVAAKTLKALFSEKDIQLLMEESLMMKKFDHPNVLNLIGVCVDSNSAPLLVVPFMANGSLLHYLKRERPRLTVAEQCDSDLIEETQRILMSMCLQVAKGMDYLATQKFVHRDLAARNCMIDEHGLIKVADFGLSEDIYARNYFRQGKEEEAIKLPVKWMALESLQDGIFTEKTDIWSFGVTCWEIFSLGRIPYPGVDPITLVKYLEQGRRLEKPSNAACSEEIFSVLLRCWEECVDKRPKFSELIHDITSILESVAGYVDFTFTSRESDPDNARPGYDHLEELDTHHGVSNVHNEEEEEENKAKVGKEEAISKSSRENNDEIDEERLMMDEHAYDHLA